MVLEMPSLHNKMAMAKLSQMMRPMTYSKGYSLRTAKGKSVDLFAFHKLSYLMLETKDICFLYLSFSN